LDTQPDTLSYQVELPAQLHARHLHDRFHRSKLHLHHTNDNVLFPHREPHAYYDFGTPDDQEWLVDEIITHTWEKDALMFQVRWNLGDTTWEPHQRCKELQALENYLHLISMEHPLDLPCRDGHSPACPLIGN
jgi:hypothetical protein